MASRKASKDRGGVRDAVAAAWKASVAGKAMFLYSCLFDLLFLFLAGTFNAVVVRKLTGLMYVVGGLLSKAGLDATGQPGLLELLGKAGAWDYVAKLAVLFILWLGGLYFLYCLFQGLCWRFARQMLSKAAGENIRDAVLRFARLNIRWAAVFIGLNILLFVAAYISTSAAKRAEVSIHPLWYAPYLLLLYAALVSYSRGTSAGALKGAWRRKRELLPAFLLIVLGFVAINYAMVGAGSLGRPGLIIAGFGLFIPALTFARLFWLARCGA